jgi:hypothetical protein
LLLRKRRLGDKKHELAFEKMSVGRHGTILLVRKHPLDPVTSTFSWFLCGFGGVFFDAAST